MSVMDLLITGLCAFVPKYPLEDWGQHLDNEMTVLLAESAKPVPGHSGHAHEQHELHVPVLVCPEKYVVYGEEFRSPDATFQSTPYPGNQDSEELMAVFYLDDQDITIKPDQNTELTVNLGEVKDCPTSNLTSFYWVTPLAEVNPGSETVRNSCFDQVADPSVISRLQLDQGEITTAKLATNLAREILLWHFDETDAQKGHAESKLKEGQAIAAVVGVRFNLDDEYGIEFVTRLLHDESSNRRVNAIFAQAPGKSLRIRLEPSDDNKRRVWIKNMPLLDILQVRKLREPKYDDHFAHMYKLSKDSAVKKKVPITSGETCTDSGFDNRHGAGTDCPSPRMKRDSSTNRRG
jgi:hypothetical protein